MRAVTHAVLYAALLFCALAGNAAGAGAIERHQIEASAPCPSCALQARQWPADMDERAAAAAPIGEPDWLTVLMQAVNEADRRGLFEKAHAKTREELRSHAVNPVELGLPTAKENRVRKWPLLDEERVSRMAAPVQKTLEGFARSYLFFDAGNDKQLRFVKSLTGIGVTVKPVATGGDVREAAQWLGHFVWADQGGNLKRRFHLQAVPSLVRLAFDKGRVTVRVEEIALDDEPFEEKTNPKPAAP